MQFYTPKITIFILIILLAGCASSKEYRKTTASPEKLKSIAVILGEGGGPAGFLKDIFIPLGTSIDIDLTEIDGKKAIVPPGAEPREYWLDPGEYKLKASCEVRVDGSIVASNSHTFTDHLEAGKVYYLVGIVLPNENAGMFDPKNYCKADLKTLGGA